MRCNATLTTLTPTDDVVATGPYYTAWQDRIPDGVTVTRRGDRLYRDDVTVVACDMNDGHPAAHCDHEGREWEDHWPGATPHSGPDCNHIDSQCEACTDPMDELVAVSEEAGLYDDPCPDCERGKVRRGFFDVPCPSCGGSGTRPADGCDGKDCRIPAAHTDPTVADAEVSEAWEAAYRVSDISPSMSQIRAALETFAAARAREENRDG